jgi:hypothetical protein
MGTGVSKQRCISGNVCSDIQRRCFPRSGSVNSGRGASTSSGLSGRASCGVCKNWLILLQEADFLEQSQVIYVMDILRDLLPPPSSTPSTPRLPTYSVMLLAHALRSTFYPSSFLYPIVSRFLLQRPELDMTDVPMLYSLLYSSEDGEWIKERTWMIRFLTDAMHEGSARDWAVLKRRHTWDLVASIWQATKLEERTLRRVVLEVRVSWLIPAAFFFYF